MRNDYPQFRSAGGDVAVITLGTPAQVARFRERLSLPFTCLSDPTQEAYRAFSVPRGSVRQIAGPRVWFAGLQAIWRGGLGVPQGDPFQLQSAFVIDRHGTTRFAHRPTTSADLPDHEQMLAAIRSAAAI